MEIKSPVIGKAKKLKSLKDGVFSAEMMGPGVAITPSNGTIVAPITGKLTTVFPTGHAFGITAKDGTTILIHIGLDTVNLQGKGFTLKVKQGKKIKAGKPLVEVDLDYVKDNAPSIDTIVVVTPESATKVTKKMETGKVDLSTVIIETT